MEPIPENTIGKTVRGALIRKTPAPMDLNSNFPLALRKW